MGEDSKAPPPVQQPGRQTFVTGDAMKGFGVPPAPPQAQPAPTYRPTFITEGALPPPPPPQAAQPAPASGGANTPQPTVPAPSSSGGSTTSSNS
jgi:hypothetical protein